MNISNYLANALLSQVFRATEYTPPETVYIALYTSDPTKADIGTEVSGGSYARQAVAFNAPTAVSGKQTMRNNADVSFPVATADWGTITHIGIRDASTNGNLLYFGAIQNPRTILTNDRLKFIENDLVIDLS